MISRNQTVDPKGLMHCFPLLDDLIKLSKTAEIHSQPIRQAFLKLLQENPNINDTKFNGSVFVNLKADRIGVLLCHLRRLKIQGDMGACASKLTSAEFGLLQKLVDSVETKVSPQEKAPRKLKKELSEVSQDSKGYPSCLKSPAKANTLTKGKTKKQAKRRLHHLPSLEGGLGKRQGLLGKSRRKPMKGTWQKLWVLEAKRRRQRKRRLCQTLPKGWKGFENACCQATLPKGGFAYWQGTLGEAEGL